MSITTKGIAALVVTLAAVAPSTAVARDHGDHGPRGDRGERNIPSRVATKVRAADRALDRAQERADDGETAGALAALSAVRKHLASATKAAKKRVGTASGPPAVGAVARLDHVIVGGAAGMMDGAGEDVSDAAAATLKAALDSRDELLASVGALDADAQDRYERVLRRMARDVEGELEDLGEALADDELTDGARAALTAAVTQLGATASAIAALEGADDADGAGADYPGGVEGASSEGDGDGDRPCRRPGGPRPEGPGGQGTGYEGQVPAGSDG